MISPARWLRARRARREREKHDACDPNCIYHVPDYFGFELLGRRCSICYVEPTQDEVAGALAELSGETLEEAKSEAIERLAEAFDVPIELLESDVPARINFPGGRFIDGSQYGQHVDMPKISGGIVETHRLSVDQLEALPEGTVLRWVNGVIWDKTRVDRDRPWQSIGSDRSWPSKHLADFPLQILWQSKPEPIWEPISTDRYTPTDAVVNGVPGRYWRSDHWLHFAGHDRSRSNATLPLDRVTSVEPLRLSETDPSVVD